MAFNTMIGQMNSQRVGLPMSTYNPYAAAALNQQQYLMLQAQNRLMGLAHQQTQPNATNTSSNQVIELD